MSFFLKKGRRERRDDNNYCFENSYFTSDKITELFKGLENRREASNHRFRLTSHMMLSCNDWTDTSNNKRLTTLLFFRQNTSIRIIRFWE